MRPGRDLGALQDALVTALELTPEAQRVRLTLYRQLAAGEPVSPESLASALGLAVNQVKETLERCAPSAVDYDEQGCVVSCGGLSLTPTAHRFNVGDLRLYTWCALDALCFPHVLNKRAQVESTCPISGQPIRLTVGPSGLEECEPRRAFVSVVTPEASQVQQDVRKNVCCHIRFFASEDAARTWLSQHRSAFVLPVTEASDLAQTLAARRFGDALAAPAQGPERGKEK